jgi:DeoR/GlpR family transcriptional regulator of sugar metabolism
MLAIERRSRIIAVLEKQKSASVTELADLFHVSGETVRRDFEKLSRDGLISKTYGGAVLRDNMAVEPSFRMREKTNQNEKLTVAQKAARLVEDNSSVIIDASSTGVMVAKQLRDKRGLTIITNSVEILLDYANRRGTQVISTGGTLREMSLSLVGRNAERTLREYTADKTVISCKGLDLEQGVTESNEAEMEIKKIMLEHGRDIILAVDSSKFNKRSFVRIADISRVHCVVTDKAPPEEWTRFFAENNIRVL